MKTTTPKGQLHITVSIAGDIEFQVGRTSVPQRQFWYIMADRAAMTTAAVAEELNVSRRTVEGWRQGRPIAARYRPALHAFIDRVNQA